MKAKMPVARSRPPTKFACDDRKARLDAGLFAYTDAIGYCQHQVFAAGGSSTIQSAIEA
jgi:hypothetical protein